MAMPYVETSYTTPKQVLMFPDEYEAFAQTFTSSDTAVATVDGRKVIQAGTIWPANDATAKGVVLYDVDVNDGDGAGSVVFSGAIRKSALPVEPAAAAVSALPRVTFF